jgi:hypothetical protein
MKKKKDFFFVESYFFVLLYPFSSSCEVRHTTKEWSTQDGLDKNDAFSRRKK